MKRAKASSKEPEASSLFAVSLVLLDRERVPGLLVDLNAEGAAVSFPGDDCPDFEQNERVRLALTVLETKREMPLDAHVARISKAGDHSLCLFSFIDTSSAFEELDPALLSYLNRRDAFRVSPDPLDRVEVDVQWDDGSARGWMLDISLRGMWLVIEGDTPPAFEPSDRLTLSFRLPGHESPLAIAGEAVRHNAVRGNVAYGIEFFWERTEDFGRQERAVSQYAMRRQVSALRQRGSPGQDTDS